MGYSARTLVSTVPAATALIDADGRVVVANGRWTVAGVGDVHAAEGALLPGAGYAALFAALRAASPETLACRHGEADDNRFLRVVPVTDDADAPGYLFTVDRIPPRSCPVCVAKPAAGTAPATRAASAAGPTTDTTTGPTTGDNGLTMTADDAKSEFLSLLGHEIRTPVTAVVGMVELMRSLPVPLEVREVVDGVHRSTQSLKVLVDDLLDLARMEADRLELVIQPLSLRTLLESVIEPLQEDARRKGILLLAGVAPGVPATVLGDAGRLRQVLTNLVGNAMKFTERGEVVVSAEPETYGRLLIEVSDTGPGLDAAAQVRVFAPFVQADSSPARRYEGAGLGLAVAARLVARMGGSVEVDSEPGVGSRFRIRLPLPAGDDGAIVDTPVPRLAVRRIAVVAPTPRATRVLCWALGAAGTEAVPATLADIIDRTVAFDAVLWCDDAHDRMAVQRRKQVRAAVGPQGRAIMLSTTDPRTGIARGPSLITSPITLRRLVAAINAERHGVRGAPIPVDPLPAGRVLLAEDNDVNRGVFQRIIRLLGLECDAVADGAAAVAAVLGEPRYDVVLMDVQMPGVDGLEATRRIRAAGVTIPILALTASAMRGDRERCAAAGMNAHVSKPVTLLELRAALADYLTGPPATPRPAPAHPTADPTARPTVDPAAGPAAGPDAADEPALEPATVDLDRLKDLEEQLADRPLMIKTVATFLGELTGRRAALTAALDRLDRDGLRAGAHTLKSSSALLGANTLATACAQVERRAAVATEPELAALVAAVGHAATGSAAALGGYLTDCRTRQVGRSC